MAQLLTKVEILFPFTLTHQMVQGDHLSNVLPAILDPPTPSQPHPYIVIAMDNYYIWQVLQYPPKLHHKKSQKYKKNSDSTPQSLFTSEMVVSSPSVLGHA